MADLQALLDNAGTWQLVAARSSVQFKNKTFWGLATVTGEFSDVRGTGQITASGAVTGRLDIRATSLTTGNKKRDDHLRSADFFDVENHPQIRVEVMALAPTGAATADVQAALTVRGVTEPLPLSVSVDRLGDGTVHVRTKTTIDRSRLGVSGNMVGMMPTTTTLLADLVFAKAD